MTLPHRWRVVAALALVALAQGVIAGQSTPAHDKAFWRRIADSKFAVPAGASVPALVSELSRGLASTDPELRDDLAYSILTAWIYRQRIVPVDLRRALIAEWTANLKVGIGDQGTDTVFRRSFSALSLGTLAILDNEAPYLEKAEFDSLLAATIAYLHDERDTRGFDPAKGWVHSVAHTADLLKFLARSRHLQPLQQALILGALADKVSRVNGVLIHGEDERLARAALSIAARTDWDQAGFRAWVTALAPARATAPPTPASLAAEQNRKHLIVALYAVLSTDARSLPALQTARDIVLAAMKTFM